MDTMHRVLDDGGLEASDLAADEALELYRHMVRARTFDERALKLQRRGWMSGYPPYRGQEASQVAAAWAMEDDDWLFPTYRSNAMLLTQGVDMMDILLFRRGFSEFHRDEDRETIFPQAIPIATQVPHAVGAAMAAAHRGEDHAVVCYFGDGATSEGDFHEGANFAGVFDAPVVLFCENNHWAISVPESRQSAADMIAQKATAYGFDGVRVDGTDPLAVAEMTTDALATARQGEPILLESLTYRHGPHTTADNPERYRDRSSVPEWRRRDPLERFETALLAAGVLDEATVDEFAEAADSEFTEARAAAEAVEEDSPTAIFDYVYEQLDSRLDNQRAALLERQQ